MAIDEHAIPEVPTHQEVARDIMGRHQYISPRYRSWVTLLVVLFLLGVVGFVIRVADGFDDRTNWGYYVATLSFLMSTFVAMPIISAGLRLAKAHWRRPITRVTENMAIAGLFVTLMLIPALIALPPLEGRLNVWFDFPHYMTPVGWNLLAYGTLAFIGLALMWSLAVPDLAAVRDHLLPSRRQRLAGRLALGWTGNLRQWRVLHMGVLIMGAMYLLTYPLIQTLLISDFHAGLLPGLKDAIAPATAVVAALQSATGLTLLVLYLMRRFGGYENYFTVDQFWAFSKPLLAFSLLWFYFWWASFITFWYGRQPGESAPVTVPDPRFLPRALHGLLLPQLLGAIDRARMEPGQAQYLGARPRWYRYRHRRVHQPHPALRLCLLGRGPRSARSEPHTTGPVACRP